MHGWQDARLYGTIIRSPSTALYQALKTCTVDSRLLRSLAGAVLRGT